MVSEFDNSRNLCGGAWQSPSSPILSFRCGYLEEAVGGITGSIRPRDCTISATKVELNPRSPTGTLLGGSEVCMESEQLPCHLVQSYCSVIAGHQGQLHGHAR